MHRRLWPQGCSAPCQPSLVKAEPIAAGTKPGTDVHSTLILGALALCLAAPSVASADSFVITTHRHHHHHHHWNNNDGVVIYRDGQRLHHRHHGEQAFYDNGNRNWRRHYHHHSDAVSSAVRWTVRCIGIIIASSSSRTTTTIIDPRIQGPKGPDTDSAKSTCPCLSGLHLTRTFHDKSGFVRFCPAFNHRSTAARS